MDQALQNIQSSYPLSPDGKNPWVDKNFNDFSEFFQKWFDLLPVNRCSIPGAFPPGQCVDEFEYVTMFGGFYYLNKTAQNLVTFPGLFRTWSRYFMNCKGEFMDSPESTRTIDLWLTDPSIDNDDFDGGPFSSFNDFFTRDLANEDRRPIAKLDNDAVMVAPTDCVLNMIQPLTPETKISTKGNQELDVTELLKGSEYASKFENGTAISCILLPHTYHHYHAVVGGNVVDSKEDVTGAYYGIPDFPSFLNDGNIGYGQPYEVFKNFRRGYVVIKTDVKYPGDADNVHVAMVAVGLDTIGSVVFEDNFKNVVPPATMKVEKGEKIGHFAYGGSMVITLVEKGISSIQVLQGAQIGRFDPVIPPICPVCNNPQGK
jgi:phosphatidylserine decarboxylase